jgi:hypothetical protein
MLPHFLSSSYTRYKEDTKKIATWLACTADSHGLLEKPFLAQRKVNDTEQSTPMGRLKGKARKEAKVAAQNKPKVCHENGLTAAGFGIEKRFLYPVDTRS